jgi:hypothetical protein
LEQLELALNTVKIDDVSRARIRSKRDRLSEMQLGEEPPAAQLPSRLGL